MPVLLNRLRRSPRLVSVWDCVFAIVGRFMVFALTPTSHRHPAPAPVTRHALPRLWSCPARRRRGLQTSVLEGETSGRAIVRNDDGSEPSPLVKLKPDLPIPRGNHSRRGRLVAVAQAVCKLDVWKRRAAQPLSRFLKLAAVRVERQELETTPGERIAFAVVTASCSRVHQRRQDRNGIGIDLRYPRRGPASGPQIAPPLRSGGQLQR